MGLWHAGDHHQYRRVLSIGLFFSLMLVGLAQMLPQSMEAGCLPNVPADVARQVAATPPVASLFAAFLGYGDGRASFRRMRCTPCRPRALQRQEILLSALMSAPFKNGLFYAFTFPALLYVVAAFCSWRGGSGGVRQRRTHRDSRKTGTAAE